MQTPDTPRYTGMTVIPHGTLSLCRPQTRRTHPQATAGWHISPSSGPVLTGRRFSPAGVGHTCPAPPCTSTTRPSRVREGARSCHRSICMSSAVALGSIARCRVGLPCESRAVAHGTRADHVDGDMGGEQGIACARGHTTRRSSTCGPAPTSHTTPTSSLAPLAPLAPKAHPL